MSTDQSIQQGSAPQPSPRDADERDHPDRRGPRGNQQVETVDVERGQDKLDRVLGW